MKKQRQETPELPLDIVVKIAFFVPEWSTMELFMGALRPANVLEPLEHLWQLKELKWNPRDLWPHLNLARLDETSRSHVESLAKYYSVIRVDKTVDPLWLRQHTNSSTCIQWDRFYDDKVFDFGWLTQWKNFRLTAVNKAVCHSPNSDASLLIEHLPHYKYLVKLTWSDCSLALTTVIFRFAATSSTLRQLHIDAFEGNQADHCTITRSMANALLKWITLQPIHLLAIADFTWEDLSLRDQVATALLNNTSIQRFVICGLEASNISLEGSCGFDDSELSLNLYNPTRYGVESVIVPVEELNLDEITRDLSGLVEPFFQSLLNPKVKKLRLCGYGVFVNFVIWEMLLPYLPQCHLEVLDLRWNWLIDKEAFLLADGIRLMKSLKEINLHRNRLGFAGMKAIAAAAPATVNHICICRSMLTEIYLRHECNTLFELAEKKSIFFTDIKVIIE
ncbi:hypothetical protein LEN26_017869 [Aphanomyces euteiches]|nr:hypothetical protein LEN26_017869 [Aphanomyces euteiches]KAH9184728.1 hypothetical protein AeNC1_013297 [Aphanomyces euteiches]